MFNGVKRYCVTALSTLFEMLLGAAVRHRTVTKGFDDHDFCTVWLKRRPIQLAGIHTDIDVTGGRKIS